MKFSQRIGKTKIKVDIQKESMDNDLRVGIWNSFKLVYLDKVDDHWISNTKFKGLFNLLWLQHFKLPLDTLDNFFENTYKQIRDWFFNWEWYEVYDFIEFVAKTDIPNDNTSKLFMKLCNNVMEKECSAYRFINTEIVQITEEQEINEIEKVLENASKLNLKGVKVHLSTALSKLSDRKSPDYRNSIKESISSVESIVQIISGDSKAELGRALKLIEDKIGLHPALKKGFSSIYGYTSDEGGIRHAMLDEREIFYEDAKYMLVSCSSFINYLIAKSERVGLFK
jgi:hypothetical protein